jgi:hypothetical protein
MKNQNIPANLYQMYEVVIIPTGTHVSGLEEKSTGKQSGDF